MVHKPPFDRIAMLANGSKVTLGDAIRCYEQLQFAVGEVLGDGTQPGAEYLVDLRRICLGESIDESKKQRLQEADLLAQDGTVDPVMREVVFAAVRGLENTLHLDSPFTAQIDHDLAALQSSMIRLGAELPADQWHRLLSSHDVVTRLRHAASGENTGRGGLNR